jgi:hypothetical protein
MDPVHLVHPVQDSEPSLSAATVGQDWLAGASPPEVPMSSVEPDGPVNGWQPVRRVAMQTSPGTGSRR